MESLSSATGITKVFLQVTDSSLQCCVGTYFEAEFLVFFEDVRFKLDYFLSVIQGSCGPVIGRCWNRGVAQLSSGQCLGGEDVCRI